MISNQLQSLLETFSQNAIIFRLGRCCSGKFSTTLKQSLYRALSDVTKQTTYFPCDIVKCLAEIRGTEYVPILSILRGDRSPQPMRTNIYRVCKFQPHDNYVVSLLFFHE